MIFPIEDTLEWAQKYNLSVKVAKCPKCSIEIKTDIPFAITGYRGLKSPDHGCGETFTRKIMVAVDKEEIKYWASIAQTM